MSDPLLTLRTYRALAPWSLHDLTSIASGILQASGVRPINAASSVVPTERTIRFYVTRGLVTGPEGRGTAAIYGYRHLLQVLGVKLRQMEGATLAKIADGLRETTGDVLERRVAAALGDDLPPPAMLPLANGIHLSGGRASRAVHVTAGAPEDGSPPGRQWHRIEVADGIELNIRDDRARVLGPIDEAAVVAAVRQALDRPATRHSE